MLTIQIPYFPALKKVLIYCTFFAIFAINLQPNSAAEVQQQEIETCQTKEELAREVLIEMDIANSYNLYLGNILDMALPSDSAEYRSWMQEVLEQNAGWLKVEDQYVNRLTADFSTAELTELLTLSKEPLVRKLIQSKMKAYFDTTKTRQEVLLKVWDDYNAGVINPPPSALP